MADFGKTTNLGSVAGSGTFTNWRMMGGTFGSSSGTLDSVSIYNPSDTAYTIRVGVYTGGSLTDPNGATLVEDLGTFTEADPGHTTGGFITCPASGVETIPANDPVWVALVTGGSLAVEWSSDSADAGDWQSARGRWASTAAFGTGTAFEDPISEGGSFANFWYPWYLTYTVSGGGGSVVPIIRRRKMLF